MAESPKIFGPIYDELKRRLQAAFGAKVAIETEYPREKEVTKLPAIFIEMTDLSPESSPMTGEVEIKSRWEIRLLVSAKQPSAKIVARDASARIAELLNDKVLAKIAHPAKYLGSSDDNFDLHVPGYEAWVSEFEIVVRVGLDDWGTWEFYEENLEKDLYMARERMTGDAQNAGT